MHFKILTLFPEMFENYLTSSVLGRGLKKNLWSYELINIRDFSKEKHKKVDDTPFGGGCGMVINPEVIASTIDATCNLNTTKIYYMSPRGTLFNQKKVNDILQNKEVAIICGRYEGVDQRVIDKYNIEEISIGDFVLTGGELPALTVIDCCVRCIDGVLGDKNSIDSESFGGIKNSQYDYLLEYPLYTQPRKWRNMEVPDVLVSGNHKKIDEWKIQQSEKITKERRPDLWEKYIKTK